MRSASVDLPWSMWAMIEKLRIRARATDEAYFRNGVLGVLTATQQAADQSRLRQAQGARGGQVGRPAGRQPETQRDQLCRQRATQHAVERIPDAECRQPAI